MIVYEKYEKNTDNNKPGARLKQKPEGKTATAMLCRYSSTLNRML